MFRVFSKRKYRDNIYGLINWIALSIQGMPSDNHDYIFNGFVAKAFIFLNV